MHAEREVMSSIIAVFNNFIKYFTSNFFSIKEYQEYYFKPEIFVYTLPASEIRFELDLFNLGFNFLLMLLSSKF